MMIPPEPLPPLLGLFPPAAHSPEVARKADRPPHPRLVHYHIFKNAGTSVDTMLAQNFAEDWSCFEGQHAHDGLRCEDAEALFREQPQLRAISSHLLRPPLPHHCLPIVFLRHPALRAYSVYHFTRRDTGQPFHDIARRYDWKDYLQWMLDEQRGSVVIRNYQVIHLRDASWRSRHILDARATPDDLAQACALLTHWGMVGIVEDYNRSARLYQRLYAPLVPGFSFSVHTTNRTAADLDQDDHHAHLERLCDETGWWLYDAFYRANALDLALYEHGCQILRQAGDRLLTADTNAPPAHSG